MMSVSPVEHPQRNTKNLINRRSFLKIVISLGSPVIPLNNQGGRYPEDQIGGSKSDLPAVLARSHNPKQLVPNGRRINHIFKWPEHGGRSIDALVKILGFSRFEFSIDGEEVEKPFEHMSINKIPKSGFGLRWTIPTPPKEFGHHIFTAELKSENPELLGVYSDGPIWERHFGHYEVVG